MPSGQEWKAEDLLRDGEVLGAELDTDYRVLAMTVHPSASGGGEWPISGEDLRLLVVAFPIGDFAAALRRRTDEGMELLQFQTEQLPQIIGLFDRAVPVGDPWPSTRPNRGEWGPRLSLQGTSGAPDGRSRHLHLSFVEEELLFDLHATFDELQVRDPAGNVL